MPLAALLAALPAAAICPDNHPLGYTAAGTLPGVDGVFFDRPADDGGTLRERWSADGQRLSTQPAPSAPLTPLEPVSADQCPVTLHRAKGGATELRWTDPKTRRATALATVPLRDDLRCNGVSGCFGRTERLRLGACLRAGPRRVLQLEETDSSGWCTTVTAHALLWIDPAATPVKATLAPSTAQPPPDPTARLPNPAAKKAFDRAMAAYTERRYAAAGLAFDEALRLVPSLAIARIHLAAIRALTDDPDGAAQQLEQAAALDAPLTLRHLVADPELAPLQAQPRVQSLRARLASPSASAPAP